MKDELIVTFSGVLITLIIGYVFKLATEKNERRIDVVEKRGEINELNIQLLREKITENTARDEEREKISERIENQLDRMNNKLDDLSKDIRK